jgi:hypothetical protein
MMETMPSHTVQNGIIGMIYVKNNLEKRNGLKNGVKKKNTIG